MWAFRRTSIHLRNRGLSSGTARISYGKSEIARTYLENISVGFVETQEKTFDGMLSSARFCNSFSTSSKSCSQVRNFSSQADAKSGEERDGDMEDDFSELGTPCNMVQEASSVDTNDFTSESGLYEEKDVPDAMQDDLEPDKDEVGKKGSSTMTSVIMNNPALPVSNVLDKWVEEGNKVTQTKVSQTMMYLQKQRMRVKALQFSEWLESSKHLEFIESNYATHVDLIAKVRGVIKAEEYIKNIPESLRGEKVCCSLLVNYVSESNIKKSEEIFNKMKSLGFPLTQFSCNQLLLLYTKTDKKKIADVLLLMEKENIKPSLFTYQILIDVKGQYNDITGLEQIVETMKDEGVEPNNRIKISLAQYYSNGGLKDKAEALLKELEGDDIKKNRWACQYLLPIYATIGREHDVTRIWEACEPDARWPECMAAIEAWGKLQKVEKAEKVSDKMMKLLKQPHPQHFLALLKVYTDNKMLAKGKNLVKQMEKSGCHIGPPIWDALVKLYIGAGELEKADSMLEKATKEKKGLFISYFAILDQYAKRGDIHNAEKIFLKMRQVGYEPRHRQYEALLQAYVNAKMSAHGFSDRMKGDNLWPNAFLAKQLAQVNGYEKNGI